MEQEELEYIQKLEKKSHIIVQKSLITKETIKRTNYAMSRGKMDLDVEVQRLHREIDAIDELVDELVDKAKFIVSKLSAVVLRGDLERLSKKADNLQAEKRLTKKQFEDMLAP